MYKSFCYICINFILVTIVSVFLFGCKSNKIIMKPETVSTDKATAKKKDPTIDYDEAVKHHFEMQSTSTKQMMIKSDKRRRHNNYGISRSWYDNLFNNSCFRNSCMVKTGHAHVSITKSRSCFIKE